MRTNSTSSTLFVFLPFKYINNFPPKIAVDVVEWGVYFQWEDMELILWGTTTWWWKAWKLVLYCKTKGLPVPQYHKLQLSYYSPKKYWDVLGQHERRKSLQCLCCCCWYYCWCFHSQEWSARMRTHLSWSSFPCPLLTYSPSYGLRICIQDGNVPAAWKNSICHWNTLPEILKFHKLFRKKDFHSCVCLSQNGLDRQLLNLLGWSTQENKE